MVNMTLAIPKELKEQMDAFPEINWSEVARIAFKDKIGDLRFLEEFKAQSKLTHDDSIKLGRKVNKSLSKKYKKSKLP